MGGADEAGRQPEGAAVRAMAWALAAMVACAPFLLGGARPDHQLVLCGVGVAVATATAWARIGQRIRFPWPLLGPLALVALGLAQLVPLSPGLIAALSPKTHEILDFALSDLGLYGPGQPRPLSLDPPSTLLATIHQLAFVGIAWAAAELPRGHRNRLERGLMWSSALAALLGFAHLALGATRIYGLYVPANGAPLHGYFSIFVNNNTLACFLAVGTLIGLGQAAETTDRQQRGGALTAAAISAAGVFFSASRGGQLSLLAGILAFGALTLRPGDPGAEERRLDAQRLFRASLLLAVLGGALAVLLLPDWSRTAWTELGREGKFAAWPSAWEHALAFPLFGSGRGAFAVTYPLFQGVTMASTVAHPENIVLQLACEWGLPGAALALGAGVAAWLFALRAPGADFRPRHAGLLAALAAVGASQMADFGLEAAGLSLPVAAILGLALARRPRGRRSHRVGAPWALVATVIGTVATGLIAWYGPAALGRMPNRAGIALAAVPQTAPSLEAAARAGVVDHPSDYFFAQQVAERLSTDPTADFHTVMRWMNRALYFFPRGADIHLLAARALARRGLFAQSAEEYRSALELAPWDRGPLLREAVRRFDRPDHLARVVPEDPETRRMLGNLLLTAPDEAAALRALQTLSALQADAPDDLDLWALRGTLCLKRRALDCAEAAATRLEAGQRPLVAVILRARVAVGRREPEAARALLQGVKALGARDRTFLTAAARLYRDLGDAPAALETLDRLWPLVALDPNQAAACLALRGEIELRLGDAQRALGAYEHAYTLSRKAQFARGLQAAAEKLGKPELARAVLGEPRTPSGEPDDDAGLSP